MSERRETDPRAIAPELAARLARVRHVALDLDGTLYTGEVLLRATLPALARFESLGVAWSYLTNNSSRGRDGYVDKLRRLGLACRADQVLTSTDVTVEWLRRHEPRAKRVFALGTDEFCADLRRAGLEVVAAGSEPEVVVVGFDTSLNYAKLCDAAYWIARGKPYVATHPDRVCPTELPTVLVDCGAICACLRAATGRDPDAILGKPHPLTAELLLSSRGIVADELAVVGDRLYTDVALARAAAAVGVLVLSGESTASQAAASEHSPDLICADVGEFARLLAAARSGCG